MKGNQQGLLLVGVAAVVLYMVVKKSTPTAAGLPANKGQGAVGSNAGGFWGNVISNIGGGAAAGTPMLTGGQYTPGAFGISEFANGTYSANGVYVDPGQVTYNSNTGSVSESPLSGMYGVLSPATYGF